METAAIAPGLSPDERRVVVADALLRQRGVGRRELAGRLGVSVATIQADVRRLKREWREERLQDTEVLLAQHLAELAMVKSEAWRVYAASCEPKTSRTQQVTRPVDGDGGAGSGTQTMSETEGAANPNLKALELVTKCLDSRRRLLGYGFDDDPSDKARVFAFTVKIGDAVLTSGATDLIDGDVIEAEDAEFYEVDSLGRKRLTSGEDDGEGGVQ